MRCQKNVLFIALIYSVIKIVLLQSELFDSETKVKSIYINEKIVYIIDQSNDYSINIYKESKKFNYTRTFSVSKDIKKINDSSFIIIGLNSNNKICHQIFEIKRLNKNYNEHQKYNGSSDDSNGQPCHHHL